MSRRKNQYQCTGKNVWGGYCSNDMSYNSGRLRKGLCTEWQNHLYNTWYMHGLYIHGMATNPSKNQVYAGVFFAPCFYNFANFYNVIKNDPLFPQFVQNPGQYEIDKDGLYGEWSPRSVQIVTQAQHNQITAAQNPGCKTKNIYRPVLYNGVVYPTRVALAQAVGKSKPTITRWVKLGIVKEL